MVSMPVPRSTNSLDGRSGGALTGISISIRPRVPKMCTRWYGTICVLQVPAR
jgi:hypothetical protein